MRTREELLELLEINDKAMQGDVEATIRLSEELIFNDKKKNQKKEGKENGNKQIQ